LKYIRWPRENTGPDGAGRNILLLIAIVFAAWSLVAAACISVPAASDKETGSMLNNTMQYIKQHHTDAAPFITENISFTQVAASDKRKIGYNRVDYSGGGWTVTVGHAATAVIIEEISASYDNGKIVWTGRNQDGVISEDSYNYTQ
jgi:hypothetical protein